MNKNIFISKNKYLHQDEKKITIVTQYFPPDFASTGQLINELTSNKVSKYILKNKLYKNCYNKTKKKTKNFFKDKRNKTLKNKK